jgi:DNA invertase Pin-like site-specific DNA recombinase
MKQTAVAYFRTSSATNVGADKDSDDRQRTACQAYAKAAGVKIIHEFYDAAVSGADPIDARPAFIDMLKYCQANEINQIVVETSSRFARDLGVQIVGHDMLRDLGIDLIAADSPQAFVDDQPTAVMMRQVLGAVSQFQKAELVAKLKSGRDRKREKTGKCEGRKSWLEMDPDMITLVKRLARRNPKTKRTKSLRQIAGEIANQGYVNSKGLPFQAAQISRMLGRA